MVGVLYIVLVISNVHKYLEYQPPAHHMATEKILYSGIGIVMTLFDFSFIKAWKVCVFLLIFTL